MSPTVLLVNDVASIGGGQTVMLDVARVLVDAGFEAHIACPPGYLADEAAVVGAKWHEFEFGERRMLSRRWRVPHPRGIAARVEEGRRLVALAAEVQADIVHTGALVPHVDTVAARRRLRSRTLWHVNQLHPAYLFAGPLPDKIVTVSHAALGPSAWRRGVAHRAAVVPNGVDLTRFRPPSPAERATARDALGVDDRFTIATVARLEPLKGVDVLVRAAARARSKPTLLVIGDATGFAGGDGYARDLEVLATQLGVDARFLGSRRDVSSLLWAADAFAFASRWEAFGLVLAEASAAGLPVVTTNAGGCAEVVNEATGVLVDPDDVEGFAHAFDRLAGDPGLRSQQGASGRQRAAEHFDVATLGRRLLPHYLDLVETR
ncbi:MAG TPA: glycosyltransferase family 4 protein [Acidimicrobiales bacterium]|nr:glycosyltransferase family 4 protein [Acidimicrobiales bacterium]